MEIKNAEKIVRVLKRTVLAILVILIVLEMIVIGIGTIGGEEAVAKLPVYILKVDSDSMYPKLKDGDCIFCIDAPFENLKKGDIINYSFTGEIITHEVISVNDNQTVTTKGSMNSYDDGEISETYYVGKVLVKMPFLSVFLQLTETPAQKLIFIMLVIIACFGYPAGMAILNRQRGEQRGKKKRIRKRKKRK